MGVIELVKEEPVVAIQNLANKAREMIRGRKPQIDKGLDKAQHAVSERTRGKYDEKISSARERADKLLSEEDTGSQAGDQQDASARDRPDEDPGSTQKR